ncbi:MAG: type II toxin-antitoxin system RelE/ParE family toxin [Lachnospiraceae bacterium]|nr:type II toxin-antitoxin system RelE/ParE family toxin [Lachnospiraceae bacterium]
MAFLLHRPRYFTKKALIISTTGGVSAESTIKALAATLPGWGFNKCYQLPVTALSWNDYKPTKKDLRVMNFFYVGKKIVATNGFVKKTQKTPAKELKRAKIDARISFNING